MRPTSAVLREIHLRPARAEDADALVTLHLRAREHGMPYLPRLHTEEETRGWMRHVVLQQSEVWVAEVEGSDGVTGYLALEGELLDQLYVAPEHQGRGIGTRLLELAQARQERLHLHVFQRNERARQLYERAGFTLAELRDGRDNEEREPDALYRWERVTAA